MKKEHDVFATAKVCMEAFKAKYDKAMAKKKERFKNLNINFKPGSPMFIAERDRITPECTVEIEDARHDCLKAFNDALEETINCERAHATVITNDTTRLMGVLDCLKDSSVSVDEYAALVEVYGNKSYWIDRLFEKIAEKNGIFETKVQPSLTAKLEILNELAANTREYLNEYDGEKKNFPVTSSDKYIYKMEERYTNGYSGVHMSGRETAKRLVSKALGMGDSLDRSVTLSNMLRTATPDMQDEILSVLAEGERPALSDPTMNLTGVKDVVDRFIKTDGELVKAASAAMKKADSAKSHGKCTSRNPGNNRRTKTDSFQTWL